MVFVERPICAVLLALALLLLVVLVLPTTGQARGSVSGVGDSFFTSPLRGEVGEHSEPGEGERAYRES
jgi:hypothetical protein